MMERDPMDLEIEELIRREFEAAAQQARVPPPEVVWLQAQMRAREEEARKAVLPIVIGQAVGIAAFVGLLISLLSHLSLAQLPDLPIALIEAVVGSWLVLAPLALYLAFSRD